MKIAFFELENWEKDKIKKSLKKHNVLFFKEPLSKSNIEKIKDAEIISVFIYSKITREIIDSLPKLKFIAAMSTGYEHIDTSYCKKKNILVSNVPVYGSNTVAEHTFALILALSRKLYQSIKITHEQHSFETDSSLTGFDLKGKTLGIIGCGNIGKNVARIGVGFQMNVLAYDRHPDKKTAEQLGFKYKSFDNVLKKSDIITLHLSYNKETHHLINKSSIGKMKKGVVIINTARGGIIDTHALIEGLNKKQISGAALDVLEGECEIKEEKIVLTSNFKKSCDLKTLLEDHMLMKMNNVIITPHNAFNSREALERILETTIGNINSFINKKIENTVT